MPGKKETFEREISEMDQYVIDKVRELRVNKQLSQVALSISMGMSEGFIGRVENPKLKDHYNLRHINILADSLNCSPKDFFPDKPLPSDMIMYKYKMVRQPKSSKGKPNYEVIKKIILKEK